MKPIITYLVIVCTIINWLPELFAGNQFGSPFIESFSSDSYRAGSQNWDITQDGRFVIYFANNDGLLEFDGANWQTFPLPDKTIVRSVEVDANGWIYAGGQNEIGRFQPNNIGEWKYHSLKDSIPRAHRDFEDVWDLKILPDGFFFRSSGKLYLFGEKGWTIDDQLSIKFLERADNGILAQDVSGLLYWYKGGEWSRLEGSEVLYGSTMTGMIAVSDGHFLVTTVENGIFQFKNGRIERWSSQLDGFLKSNFINCAARLYDGSIALGTYLAGLLILDADGQVRYHITKNDGLLNNNISSLYTDASHNLWVASGGGINLVQVNSPFLRIFPDGDLKGTGYAIKAFDDKLYFGTSNGLFHISWPEASQDLEAFKTFVPVAGTSGQTWGLDIVDGELMLSHHKGAFRISGDKAFEVLAGTGIWLVENYKDGESVAGTYEGVRWLSHPAGTFKESAVKTDFRESSRFLEIDDRGNVWISHPYRGVFRLTLQNDTLDVFQYGAEEGLAGTLHNHLFKVNNRIIVCGERGVFTYDDATDRFQPQESLNRVFGENTKIRRLFEAPNGDIWFVTQDNVGVLKVTDKLLDKEIVKIEFPELRALLNDGFESIYPYDESQIFLTAKQGFIQYLPENELAADSSFQLLLKEVKIYDSKDSIIFSGVFSDSGIVTAHPPGSTRQVFSRRMKGFQFTYTATEFTGNEELQFRHQLVGYEDHWSDWSNQRIKEYTNLPPGEYSFKVEARKLSGQVTPTFSYAFEIGRPWFATALFKAIYVIFAILFVFMMLRFNRKRFEVIRREADQTVKRSKEEIDRLEQEKIKIQLEHKNRELVSSAMHLSRKNEILTQITDDLSKIEAECKDDQTIAKLQKLKHLLRNEEVVEEGWEDRMFHFNEFYGDYMNALKEKFPSLSPKDLKLCTYLKMNLSTKEIATIMSVSIRAVEASRYRLRKKMDLASEDNLTEVLMNFK